MLERLKTHLLSEHTKNYVAHPTFFNIFASFFCAALMLAWGGWCWYLGWRTWHTGSAIVKNVNVSTTDAPLVYYALIAGVVFLGAFSLDAAVQYAIEGILRIRRCCQE